MSNSTYSQRYSSSDSSTAGSFVFDTISAQDWAVSKLAWGAEGSANYVALASALPVQPGTGAEWAITAAALPLPSGAATAANQSTANGHLATLAGAVSGTEVQVDVLTMPTVTIQDGGGAITVDGSVSISGSVAVTNAALAVTGGGVEASALRVTIASDSTGVLSIDDNGSSLTVDGTVAATQSGNWSVRAQDGSGNALASATTTPGNSDRGLVTRSVLYGIDVGGDENTYAVHVDSSGRVEVSVPPVQIGDGQEAHDVAAAMSNPLLVGGYASAAAPSDVSADNDAVRAWFLRNGSQVCNLAVGGTLVTSSAGLPITPASGATFAATQSGTWSVRSQDGSGNALTSAARGSERALSVQLVDGSGNQITSFGGGTQYNEDAGHSSGDTGTMALAVRNDSDTSLCGTSLDYTPLQVDANGYLKVNIKAGAGSGGTASTDDGAFTAGSGSGTPAMGFYSADTVDSGDVGVLAMDASRRLLVSLEVNNAGLGTLTEQQSQTTLLGTIDADTSTLAGAVSGTEMQVDIVSAPAIAAGDNAIGRVKITDGTDVADVLDLSNSNPLTVAVVDASGDQITSFGGGTQYTEGASDATITGTAMLMEGAADALVPVQGTAADGLLVNLGSNNDVTVSGTVTANAGTDLNTSALALESGGNLATAATLLGTIDADTSSLAGCVSGTEVQVDIVGALPAGTNAIGKLAANSGVDIGDVDVTTLCGQTISFGNGASGTAVPRVTIANDSTGVLATVSTVTTLTGGGIAHDSADSGNPVKVGGRAAATLSDDTMVANSDRSDFVTDLDGAQVTRDGFPLGDLVSERVSDTGGSSTAFTNFGAVASTRNYITAISLFNSSATTGYVDFRDGTSGSVLYTVAIPAGGGAIVAAGGTPLFRTSANTALAYDVSAALTTVYISVTGFKSKV